MSARLNIVCSIYVLKNNNKNCIIVWKLNFAFIFLQNLQKSSKYSHVYAIQQVFKRLRQFTLFPHSILKMSWEALKTSIVIHIFFKFVLACNCELRKESYRNYSKFSDTLFYCVANIFTFCTSMLPCVLCVSDLDECLTVTCLNGGTCINQIGGYVCECPPGYKGDTCAFGRI